MYYTTDNYNYMFCIFYLLYKPVCINSMMHVLRPIESIEFSIDLQAQVKSESQLFFTALLVIVQVVVVAVWLVVEKPSIEYLYGE